MGSSESTLQSMDGQTGHDNGNNSANSTADNNNTRDNGNTNDNNTSSESNNTTDIITNNKSNTSSSESRARRPQRPRRREPSPTPAASAAEPNRTDDDDQWWWEIENENLILDQVPSASGVALCPSEPEENGSASRATAIEGQDPVERAAEEEAEQPKQTLEEFKQELSVKRLARQSAVQDLRDEITSLRSKLASEQERNRQLRRSTSSGVATPSGEGEQSEEGACGGGPSKDTEDDAEDDDANPMSRGRHANIELANAQLALQLANADNLTVRTELGVVKRQVVTLKEVITCCKQMLAVKEEQCDQLKAKLSEIENSFSEREMHIMSSNLRQEYERQLVNMRQLRQLYEERQRVAAAEHENLQRLISIKRDELVAEQEKTKNFEEHNQTLMKELESVNNELAKMREECNEHKFEKKTLKEEMEAVNTLFSQMVLGFNGKNNVDIDRLATMLEENRTLLNDIANKEGNCTDGATLPKLLFELVEQASRADNPAKPLALDNDPDAPPGDQLDVPATEALQQCQQQQHQRSNKMSSSRADNVADAGIVAVDETDGHVDGVGGAAVGDVVDDGGRVARRYRETEVIGKVASAQEIIGNLPKVWKVLMELLSHHKIEQVQFAENGNGEDCYKSVETPNGLKAELSVSKTYIKLKDLIMEKKSLVKETSRLKSLNCHLEYRLNEQEKRLSAVSLELTKTWHLVGKMQRQHRQLHTQEQILRYQLQQKRRLLSELKDELEYCRRKWAVARAKNDESQEQYNDLRREFAQRKLDDAHNSAESGYSDSGPASGGEDDEVAAGGSGVGASEATATPLASTSGSTATGCGSRRKYLKEMFEHTRKIKRMQSTSPGRAAAARGIAGDGEREGDGEEIVLRWNSAPPSCGDDDDAGDLPPRALLPLNAPPLPRPRNGGRGLDDADAEADADVEAEFAEAGTSSSHTRRTGATPKSTNNNDEQREERATRIHRLEEQCKTLIQQVLETSDNRERLEIQLCRFQDEIAPVQYAVPLDELLKSKRLDRMTRASSAPAPGCLTPREEEYTRKRSERLERLEEESRQLMSRIKRTSDRGHYLRCSLDRLRRAPSSREGSFESNTEEESAAGKDLPRPQKADGEVDEEEPSASRVLTEEEKAYTARRSSRLQRLEDESRQLMNQLSRNSSRGEAIVTKLDKLHERSVSQESAAPASPTSPSIEQRMENIEKISSNRDERLAILEEEGKQLLSRLTNTSDRGSAMIQRIADRQAARRAAASAAAATAANAQGLESENDTATVLMPPLSNVACSSIVGEELNERVTVTTTASRIAAQPQPETETEMAVPQPSSGAIRKTRPLTQLSASARSKKATKATSVAKHDEEGESLEAMVRRLRELPFPSEAPKDKDGAELEVEGKEKEQYKEKEKKKEDKVEGKEDKVELKDDKEDQKEEKENQKEEMKEQKEFKEEQKDEKEEQKVETEEQQMLEAATESEKKAQD